MLLGSWTREYHSCYGSSSFYSDLLISACMSVRLVPILPIAVPRRVLSSPKLPGATWVAENLHSSALEVLYIFVFVPMSRGFLTSSMSEQTTIVWFNGYNLKKGFIYVPQITELGCLCVDKNLALSALNLGWLLHLSLGPHCLGAGWCGEVGVMPGVDTLGLCLHNDRVCQDDVSLLVLCHPSILVVLSKLC